MESGEKTGEVSHLGIAVIDQKRAEEIGCARRKDESTAHLAPFSGVTDRVDESAHLSAALIVATTGDRADHGSVVGVVERVGQIARVAGGQDQITALDGCREAALRQRLADGAAQLSSTAMVLSGGRIGVLDNGKPNARLLLTRAAEGLAERTGGHLATVAGKGAGANAATACTSQVLETLSKEVELVLTGSAD